MLRKWKTKVTSRVSQQYQMKFPNIPSDNNIPLTCNMFLKSVYDYCNTLVCLRRTKYKRENKNTPNVRNVRTWNEFYKNEEIEESTMEHETDTTMTSVSARASQSPRRRISRSFENSSSDVQRYSLMYHVSNLLFVLVT